MEILTNSITLFNLISWFIFGLIVGIIVHLIDRSSIKGGMVGTIIIGIIGALLGGFLANLFFGIGITGFNIQSFLIAIIGALIFSFTERLLLRDNERIKTKVTKLK